MDLYIIMFFIGVLMFICSLYFIKGIEKNQKLYEEQSREKVTYVSPEVLLMRYTFMRAMNGDWRARQWLTDNFLDVEKLRHEIHSDKPYKKKNQNKNNVPAKQHSQNDNKIISSEAVAALCRLGYTKAQAKITVSNYLSSKQYKNSEELIQDVFSS